MNTTKMTASAANPTAALVNFAQEEKPENSKNGLSALFSSTHNPAAIAAKNNVLS